MDLSILRFRIKFKSVTLWYCGYDERSVFLGACYFISKILCLTDVGRGKKALVIYRG